MISFYHTHDFLFRSIAEEKLTNKLFYIHFVTKFYCLQFALTQQTFMMSLTAYILLNGLNIKAIFFFFNTIFYKILKVHDAKYSFNL